MAITRLHIVSLCSFEAMVRPDGGILVQEADLHHGGGNVIVSETALTSQGSGVTYAPRIICYYVSLRSTLISIP